MYTRHAHSFCMTFLWLIYMSDTKWYMSLICNNCVQFVRSELCHMVRVASEIITSYMYMLFCNGSDQIRLRHILTHNEMSE